MDKYNIIRLSDVDSTNNYALSLRSEEVFKEGLVIVSDYQTEGQGQRGGSWESEKGKNLIISLVIEPNISIKRQFDINKIAAISVIDCLLSLGIDSKIKWPNDILVGKQKIAGILIENLISRNRVTYSIIGVGFNINQLTFNDYNPKATSLRLRFDKSFKLQNIQKKLLRDMKNRLASYRSGDYLKSDYLNAIFQKDKVSVFESRSQRFRGIIRGITDRGLLIVETDHAVKEFDLKQVRMIF